MLAGVMASIVASCATTGGVADGTTIEPAERPSGYYWNPSTATVAPGGTIGFRNPGKVVPHGLHWSGGPEKPTCSGIPVDSSGTEWSGTCTFAQAGTYSFVCTVHPEMQGSITVASGETAPPPSPGPNPGQGPEPVLNGTAAEALRLRGLQRGHAVRGSIDLSSGAVGGRMTLELRATSAALGAAGTGTVRVGRLVRGPLSAGRQSFAVALKPVARRALERRKRLPLSVAILVTPPEGTAVTLKRKVIVHA